MRILLDFKLLGIPLVYFILMVILLALTMLTPIMGLQIWALVMIMVIICSSLVAIFTEYRYGLLLLMVYTFFLFRIGTILNTSLPLGVPFDILLFLILIATLIANTKRDGSAQIVSHRNPFKSPIGIALLVFAAMDLLAALNPISDSILYAVSPLRITISMLITFFVFYYAFDNFRFIKLFIIVWLSLALIGAIYGLKQEYLGLTSDEWAWITSDPRRFSLMYQWGHVRKWSIFSDVSSFGIMMSFSGISCLILALGPFKTIYRVFALIAGILMVWSMTFSGTRTATAMVPLGLAIYFILNMNNKVTIGIAVLAVVVFIGILFGPFYGPTFTRIRSTFNTDDPSLSFRAYKRKKLQEYVLTHPIGGGLGTANETAGRLSQTYDPDNGYLRTALDKGFPGLLIQLVLFFTIMYTAITAYFKATNRKVKFILASFIGSFFAITVAQFFQDAVEQKPVNYILWGYFALVLRINEIGENPSRNEINS